MTPAVCRGPECEGAGMGHRWPGALPRRHHRLLQGRRGRSRRVRHHQGGDLQQRRQVGIRVHLGEWSSCSYCSWYIC